MFIVEDSTGLPNATSLASVQDFKDYYSLRNVTHVEFEPDLEKWDLKITYQDGKAIKVEVAE